MKKDMSKECGVGYEAHWLAAHVHHTVTEAEFDQWYKDHCAKCCYMNEVCMIGEPLDSGAGRTLGGKE